MLRLESVSRHHSQQLLLVEASMSVYGKERVGLVGPNGSGKSSIFRMLVKEEEPDGGQVVVHSNTTIGYFSQDVGDMKGRSVIDETMSGAGEVAEIGKELAKLEVLISDTSLSEAQMMQTIERYGDVQSRFLELDGYSLEARAREILAGLSFRESMIDGDVGALSGGWKMRVALAKILLMRPDALLLDEPTNHLDIESIIWLESFLKAFDGALVITSHDKAFLNRIATRIVDIDGGDLISYSGNYDFYVKQRALAETQREAQAARQQAMLAKERAFIARFKARASHAAQVQSRVKKLEKIDIIPPPKRRPRVRFEFRQPSRSGDDVAVLKQVKKAYGSLTVYDGLDLTIRRGERWCVMGVNGAGKSTLLKLIAGQSQPDAGDVQVGASVKMGYFSQHAMELLTYGEPVIEWLQRQYPTANNATLRNLAGAFGFSGDAVEKPCEALSGGEKARLVLAGMLFEAPNFLVLDEPTNHLDMETKEMLVEMLARFEGTMLFVSHDREFLAALSNRVLEVSPQGARIYNGGYSEYVVESGHEAPGVG
jgi:ATPase subunit of ABC transporter with duplicated ATPase domains